MRCQPFPPALVLLPALLLLLVAAPASFLSAETIHVPGDHPTIQAAIDAASAGDTVLVAAGTYAERVRMKAAVTLRSAGDDTPGKLGLERAEATVIDGGGRDGDGPGVAMAAGATLDGFTVTNVGRYDDAEWNRHHATQGNEQPHEQIGAPGEAGIAAVGVSCIIRHNIVHHVGYTGIAIQGQEGQPASPHVARNVCYRNMGGGIGSMHKSTAVIEGNVCFENFFAGIGHDDASPLVIDNTCFGNIRAGIGISEGSCPIVRGNRCYGNRRAGIGTRTGADTRPVIEDNDCYENEMAGIGIEEEAAPWVRNNRCYRNKLAGIGVRSGAAPTIVGNECYENVLAGIGQAGDAVTVLVGNHCHHNQAAGLGFDSCLAGRSTVIDNRLLDNRLVAAGINAGWKVHLAGNEFAREGGLPPLVMVFEGAEATFTGNAFRGSGVAGIRVAGTVRADGNEFVGTELRRGGPPNFAVWALPGGDVTLTGNTMRSWRHGLHASEARVIASGNRISEFHGTAIVVTRPTVPAVVHGNTAVSKNPADQAVTVEGDAALVKYNQRIESEE